LSPAKVGWIEIVFWNSRRPIVPLLNATALWEEGFAFQFFLRAPLHCVPASQKPLHAGSICARISTPPSQKRARWGPRACGARKVFFWEAVRHDYAALARCACIGL